MLDSVITPSLQGYVSLFHSTHSFLTGKDNSSFTLYKKIKTFLSPFLSFKLMASSCHPHSQTSERRESSPISPSAHRHRFRASSAAIWLSPPLLTETTPGEITHDFLTSKTKGVFSGQILVGFYKALSILA